MDGREIEPQRVTARTRWGVLVLAALVATFGGLWLSARACEIRGDDWFWFPIDGGNGPTFWGCEVTDE